MEVSPGVEVIDAPDFPDWVKPGSLATTKALDQLRQQPELEWSFLAPSAQLELRERTGTFRSGTTTLVDAKGHKADLRSPPWQEESD